MAGNIVNNARLAFNPAGSQTFAGVVSGAGSLSKDGNGTLHLSGANTYAGGTNVTGGTLALDVSNALLDTGAVTLADPGATLQLLSSDQLGTLTNGGTVLARGGSTSNGLITTQTGSVLRVIGAGGSSSLTVANGFTNTAAIELTSSGGGFGATLHVGTAGTLTNSPTGTITSLVGSAGARNLGAQLDTQGLITVAQNLTTNKASADHVNSGTIDLTTGELSELLRLSKQTSTLDHWRLLSRAHVKVGRKSQ